MSRDDGLGEWCTHTHRVGAPDECCVHPAAVQAVIDAARGWRNEWVHAHAWGDGRDDPRLKQAEQAVFAAVRALDGGAE